MKIAVTSTDGKHIDTHFGKAETIYIYEFSDEKLNYLETRDTRKYCNPDPKHAFDPDAFDRVYQTISDCEVLYTQKIGQVPAEKCRSLGLKVKECEGKIAKVIGV